MPLKVQTHQGEVVLRSACLGVCAGSRDEVYVAEVQAGSARVHILPRDVFVDAVKRRRIHAKRWCMAMPRQDCLLKRVNLPTANDDEAREMLEFEAPGLVPMQSEEMCYDHLPAGSAGEGMSSYLVFLSPRIRVEKAAGPLMEAGITPHAVIPDSVALWQWSRAQGLHEKALLVCADDDSFHVLTMSENTMRGARALKLPAGSGCDIAVILSETQRMGRPEHDTELGVESTGQIILTGCAELTEVLAEQLRSIRVSADGVGPACQVISSDAEILCQAGMNIEDMSYMCVLSALGSAHAIVDAESRSFNLIPREWQGQRLLRQGRVEWLKTIGLASAVLVLTYVLLALQVASLEKRKIALERQMAPIKEVAGALEIKKSQARLIDSQLSHRTLPLEVLVELYSRVPEGLSLSHLSMDMDPADPHIQMKGSAGSLSAAFAFPAILENSPLFKDVRPDGAQQVSRGKGVLIEYGCRCRLNPARVQVLP